MIIFSPELFCYRQMLKVVMVLNLCICIIIPCEMTESFSIWKRKARGNWVMCREWTHGGDMPTYLHNSPMFFVIALLSVPSVLKLHFFSYYSVFHLTYWGGNERKKSSLFFSQSLEEGWQNDSSFFTAPVRVRL